MNLLFIASFLMNISLDPIEASFPGNLGCWDSGSLRVSAEGFLVKDQRRVLVFDHQGRLKLTLALPYRVWTMSFVGPDQIIASGFSFSNGDITYRTDVYLAGELIKTRDVFFRSLHRVGDQLFGTQFEQEFNQGKYPPIFSVIDPLTLETKETFFKVPKEVVAAPGQTKAFWITARDDLFIILGPATPRLYFSTPLVRQKEKRLGQSTIGISPFLDLDGNQRQIPPEKAVLPETFTLLARAKVLVQTKRFRYSYNLYFNQVGNGYVMCYEVPDRIDGLFVGNHLGIQFLDEGFKPKGKPLERFGQIMGSYDGHVYIFYAEGQIAMPDTVSIRAHYKQPDVNRLDSLAELMKYYREPQPRKPFRPVIEMIEVP